MEFTQILLEQRGAVRILTLNRPDSRNPITDPIMIEEILTALARVQADPATRVLIVTGAGSAFSAGGNVKDMQLRKGMFAGDPDQVRNNYRSGIQRIPLAMQRLDTPTIAAVNGAAIGAGCDLACMCDIRIAGEKARFGETFVAVGLIPGDGGAFFLPRIVGFAKALELTFTARVIDAEEALRIGLVNEVTAQDRLLERSLEVAASIARHPARVLRLAKRLLYQVQGKNLEDTLELSAAYQALCHHSPEHQAALEAFFAQQEQRRDRQGER